MTLAPPDAMTDAEPDAEPDTEADTELKPEPDAEPDAEPDSGPGPPPAVATVTVVLVLRGPASALPQTLDSLARQTRRPDRLVVVDLGESGNAVETVRTHAALAAAVPDTTYVTVPAATSVAAAVHAALDDDALRDAPAVPRGHRAPEVGRDAGAAPVQPTEHLWVLTCDSAAAPMTLVRLLDAVRSSQSVAVAGPKLLDWTVPGALRSVGIQLTRSGRLIPLPVVGEPDQGQYDRRSDVLAVPATGMLVERGLFDHLAGPDRAFGSFGADVDFSWRAHQAGRRVVVVPRATLRTGAPALDSDLRPPRRRTRRRRTCRPAARRRRWPLRGHLRSCDGHRRPDTRCP